MIPRYQKILFSALLAGIALMATILFYEHKRVQDRLAAATDAAPIAAPVDSSTETVTFDLANDSDGSIVAQERQLALPQEPSVRARALLERLLGDYALPQSTHALTSGAAVDDVFLLKLPIGSPSAAAGAHTADSPARSIRRNAEASHGEELAVINFRGTFVDKHPSGVEVETLTIQSILGTLHANFPQITQVRFLVDGQPHDTLAGHADLTRVYTVSDTTRGTQAPTSGSGDK